MRKVLSLLLFSYLAISCTPGDFLYFTLTSGDVSTVVVGQQFSTSVVVWGGISPYRVVWVSGFFPPGIVFYPSLFVIRGVATQTGVYTVVLECWDGRGFWVRRTFTFLVISSYFPLSLPSADLPIAFSGKPYSANLPFPPDFPAVKWWLAEGKLPAGLQLIPQGIIKGIPEQKGDFYFLVSGEASSGETLQFTFLLSVR